MDDSISLPSQSVAYAFTLAAEKHLLFDTLSSDPGLQWSLTGPDGPVVISMSLLTQDGLNSPSMPLLDLPAGAYTLTVSGAGNATGAYSFRILDATSAASSVTSFKLGADVTAKLDMATGAVLYGFTAKAGDTVSFNVQSGADTAVWRLLDPYGRPVFGPSRAESQTGITLGATGTYVLVIKGTLNASSVATVKFASSLDSHTDPVPLTGIAITLGTAVSDSFSAANGENDYVFTVAAGARLYFDSLSTDSAPVELQHCRAARRRDPWHGLHQLGRHRKPQSGGDRPAACGHVPIACHQWWLHRWIQLQSARPRAAECDAADGWKYAAGYVEPGEQHAGLYIRRDGGHQRVCGGQRRHRAFPVCRCPADRPSGPGDPGADHYRQHGAEHPCHRQLHVAGGGRTQQRLLQWLHQLFTGVVENRQSGTAGDHTRAKRQRPDRRRQRDQHLHAESRSRRQVGAEQLHQRSRQRNWLSSGPTAR